MKLVLLTIFFASQSAFCVLDKKSRIIVIERHLEQKNKKHDGPPLYVSDVYTNGKPDASFNKLLDNINNSYPLLTHAEIRDCIEYCSRHKDDDCDIIAECQEFVLWKAENLSILKDKESSFEEYRKQLS